VYGNEQAQNDVGRAPGQRKVVRSCRCGIHLSPRVKGRRGTGYLGGGRTCTRAAGSLQQAGFNLACVYESTYL